MAEKMMQWRKTYMKLLEDVMKELDASPPAWIPWHKYIDMCNAATTYNSKVNWYTYKLGDFKIGIHTNAFYTCGKCVSCLYNKKQV